MRSGRGSMVLSAILVFSIAALVASQTDSEKELLKQVGKGCILYNIADANDEGDICRNDFDGNGGVVKTKIATGRDVTLTRDGRCMFWVKNNEIWFAQANGSGAKKLSTRTYPSTIDYLRACSAGEYAVIYSVGKLEVYAMDKDGNESLVVKQSGTSYVSFLDMYADWIIWRWQTDVYVGQFKGTPLKSGATGVTKLAAYRCAGTFSPDGLRAAVNTDGHLGIYYFKRSGLSSNSWSADGGNSDLWPFKLHKYHWSNKNEWIVARAQDCTGSTCGIYAINTVGNKLVRLAFESTPCGDPSMFIGDPGVTEADRERLTAPHFSLTCPAQSNMPRFDLRGARLGGEVGRGSSGAAQSVRIDPAGHVIFHWLSR